MALGIKYFRFGEFRLYPTENLLLREDTTIPLAPKAFDILLYLVQNGGRLVKRETLMEAIWPDSFVEETNLTVNISLLRKTLDTAPDGQPYIETVPRKGYRFNATVTECEEDGEGKYRKSNESVTPVRGVAPEALGGAVAVTPVAADQPVPSPMASPIPVPAMALPPAAGWKTSATRIVFITALIIVLAVGLFYFWSHSKAHSATVSASERSIAILPFRPLNTAPEDEYLGLGMTDALITRLSNLHKIIVRPVGAVRKYATADDPVAAGRQLAVQSVLEGSVQRSGNGTRVTVRLWRVPDGELLWGDSFEEKSSDMFSVEDSISQKVANALTINLTGDEQKQFLRPFTESSDAYQLYMKGRFFANKRTEDGVKKSIELFQQAIEADPKFAVAYTGLADSYTLAGSYGYSILPPKEAMPQAEADCGQSALHRRQPGRGTRFAGLYQIHLRLGLGWSRAGVQAVYRAQSSL